MAKNIALYFLYFIFYSFLGWIYELLVGILEYHRGFVNRGFLFGPYLPVYGFGSLLFILLLYRKTKIRLSLFRLNLTPLLIFLSIMLLATLLELLTSYIMEATIGEWLWNYNEYFLNFQGRIALKSSLRFALGGSIILYLIHPMLESILKKQSEKQLMIIFGIVALFFFTDLAARPFLGSNFSEKRSEENSRFHS
ncbi:MAG: putative ABC transporter permease [Johnsonella sp.]|nr:putative ABC transporter permease [Johnsonella sp.]